MSPRPYNLVRRAATAQATRDRILDVALQMFQAGGYQSVTLREIAQAADVSLNAIYKSIGGKPQLLVTLIRDAIADSTQEWQIAAVQTASSGEQALRAVATALRHVLERHEWLLSEFYDAASTDPIVAEARSAGDNDYITRLRYCVARLKELEVLRGSLTEARATDIIRFYLGFLPWRQLRERGWDWDDIEEWLSARAFEVLVDPSAESALASAHKAS